MSQWEQAERLLRNAHYSATFFAFLWIAVGITFYRLGGEPHYAVLFLVAGTVSGSQGAHSKYARKAMLALQARVADPENGLRDQNVESQPILWQKLGRPKITSD